MTTADPESIRDRIERLTAEVAPLRRELAEQGWRLATTGAPDALERVRDLGLRHEQLFADPDTLAFFREIDDGAPPEDPQLRREVHVLRLAFEAGHSDPEIVERIVPLSAEVYAEFTRFRPRIDGQPVGFNDVVRVLRGSTDPAERRRYWEASKEIGAAVEPRIRELVDLRNRAARDAGDPDFYTRSLRLHELDPDRVDVILDELESRTDAAFAAVRDEIDATLAARDGVDVSELRPWHLWDPFFQDLPPAADVDIDRMAEGIDPVEVARASFTAIGLDIDPIIERSDLFERERKEEHAFCTDIDHEGDVRVLANVRPDIRSVGTLLHEMGHAVYSAGVDTRLPYFLRGAAHAAMTEAVAMFLPQRMNDAGWLARFAGIDPERVAPLLNAIHEHRRRELLVFIRWGLVVCRFERAMYRDPGQDLNGLWWDLVERIQRVRRPDDRDAPDWAAKIHIANYPAYYQNYLLGEMIAAQMADAARRIVPDGNLVDHPALGQWLTDEFFAPARSIPWEDLLERATGSRLDPARLADRLTTAG